MRRSTIATTLAGAVLLLAAAPVAAGEPATAGSPAAGTATPAATGARGTGFWRNRNGQAVIQNRCRGETSTSLSAFLTRFRPFADLPATSCPVEAAYIAGVLDDATAAGAPMRAKLKAQALATALNVYFSDAALGGNALGAPAPIGAALVDVARIARSAGLTPGTLASAFGGARGLRVYALVAAAARRAVAGGLTWYLDVRAVQELAKDVFEAINEGRAYPPPPPAAAAPPAFADEMRWPAGSGPAVIVSGDFDLDGRQDVAVADATGAQVSALIGMGDGTFPTRYSYPAGAEPAGLALGELTGDGLPDLAVASAGSNAVSLLWGNGDGTFWAGSGPFAVGQRPAAVTAADLDGDGAADLAVPNAVSGTVTVLLGDGAGFFAPTDPVGTGPQPNSVTTADLDLDGHADLITGHASPGNVDVLFGLGDATFDQPAMFYDADSGSGALASADFDEDGAPDLAVANALANDVSILLNRGDGTFWMQTNVPTATPFAGGTSPVDVEVGDLNGDGHLDLATANAGSNTASILLGDGTGGFTPEWGVSVGSKPQWLALADYDGDGRLDIASANFGSNDVSVLLNASTG